MIRIGSRGSALALWQAEHIRDALMKEHAGLAVEIEIIHTTGDRITDVPLSKIGDQGLFTKELDQAVLDGRVDMAVHSLKDVPTRVETGLMIAAVGKRADPSDALIAAPGEPGTLVELPPGSRVGTSSLRRRAQLLAVRPDVLVQDLRGNIDTRLDSVGSHKYDAIILAFAGMNRLGRAAEATEVLDLATWLPAVGQGALAVICRVEDQQTQANLRGLDDADTHVATDAERALLRQLEGGCQVPVAALATLDHDVVSLRALVASIDGKRVVRAEQQGPRAAAEAIGAALGRELLDMGARAILDELRAHNPLDLPRPSAP